MKETHIKVWKKVFEKDIEYIATELKDVVSKPAVIILSGPVGVGKTTFTRGFVYNQYQDSSTQSPTYSIINEVGEIAHADFFRIKSIEEIIHLELSLYLEDKNYFLIEWGMPYLRELKREVDEVFKFYELEIQINEEKAGIDENICSRNYLLRDIDGL